MILTAISENTVAHPGNSQPNYIIVSPTPQNGEPVTGLSATNFKVEALIVGPGGALVNISRVAGGVQGFCYVDVVPVQAHAFDNGILSNRKFSFLHIAIEQVQM